MSNFKTAAEQKILDDIAKEEAAGGDPFGDDEPIVAETIEDQARDAQAKVDRQNGVTAEAKTESAEQEVESVTAEAASEEAAKEPETIEAKAEDKPAEAKTEKPEATDDDADDDEPSPAPVIDQAKADAEQEKLQLEKDDALEKLMDKALTPKQYRDIERRVDKALSEITVQRALVEQSHRDTFAFQKRVLNVVAAEAKQSGTIDYGTDQKAQKQFNTALTLLANDQDNVGRSFKSLAREAHASVLALRGIAQAKAKADQKPEPKQAPERKVDKAPVTLRNVPAAAQPNTGGNVFDSLKTLKGAEYQAAYRRLTPAQKAALTEE